eukprot:CAMPEP_0170180548 /NCGR_PEP_ID=MMETSP0040_2-20121228/22257_1 /TAXON_ID=641309 /ORGANISM="Lotharella oceanica, Strain CCMP622" /LENGTH=102 /DNA_ID=CAMNT_0010425227 /DNA_START=395 /DNA_END=700 /DNA_ORIENTATION=-
MRKMEQTRPAGGAAGPCRLYRFVGHAQEVVLIHEVFPLASVFHQLRYVRDDAAEPEQRLMRRLDLRQKPAVALGPGELVVHHRAPPDPPRARITTFLYHRGQ